MDGTEKPFPSSSKAPRNMQIGQNSVAPENSLPQLGQTCRSSVFIDEEPHSE
jgi:hypothetical protein